MDDLTEIENRALSAFNKGDYTEASRIYYELTKTSPRNPKYYVFLGESYENLGEYELAENCRRKFSEVLHSSLAIAAAPPKRTNTTLWETEFAHAGPIPDKTRFCWNCGNKLEDYKKFCDKCGTNIGVPLQTPDVSPALHQVSSEKQKQPASIARISHVSEEPMGSLRYLPMKSRPNSRVKPRQSQTAPGIACKIFRAIIPSMITGAMFWFLIALTQGMDKINSTSVAWFFVGLVLFGVLFTFVNRGEQMLGRFFKYLAYEFWALPLFAIIYSISSVGQANSSSGIAGGIGAGIGGAMLIVLAVIIGAFGGLILFLIGNAINKRSKRMLL